MVTFIKLFVTKILLPKVVIKHRHLTYTTLICPVTVLRFVYCSINRYHLAVLLLFTSYLIVIQIEIIYLVNHHHLVHYYRLYQCHLILKDHFTYPRWIINVNFTQIITGK